MISSQQKYAQVAYESVMMVKRESDDKRNATFAQQYGQLCHRFPSLVITNGLRLATAFFEAKSGSDNSGRVYQVYLQDMKSAVGQELGGIGERNIEYLHLSRKVLQASVWFKRYTEAILKVEQGAELIELLDEDLDGTVAGDNT
ncbi:type III-B CRISPR module-associated protein Cmr5 [Paenibacillus amylolyticus]|uniref:CRISPR type III-B/RAMP module-associated protein Cmr5 n=1 Tax=Paenibacillus amylolyticus TaxID=1451 RepID=A0ABD8B2G4_PAEAM